MKQIPRETVYKKLGPDGHSKKKQTAHSRHTARTQNVRMILNTESRKCPHCVAGRAAAASHPLLAAVPSSSHSRYRLHSAASSSSPSPSSSNDI